MASESDDDLREPEQPDHTHAHPDPDTSPRRRRRSQLTVAVVAGAVLVAGGGAYWAASAADHTHDQSASDGGPPPLAIGTGVTGSAGLGTAPGPRVKVTGSLPDGPSSAPVFTPTGQVTRDQVAKLAAALRVSGTVVSQTGLWKVAPSGGGRGPTLQVSKDAPDSWAFARDGAGTACRPAAGSVSGAQVCYGAGGPAGGDGTSGGPAVPEATAKRLAAPVLAALGITDATVDASRTVGSVRTVTADPVVGGLPTHGWQTIVQVGPDGVLANGTGRMVPLTRGASYPVVSAQRALDELRKPGNAVAPPPRPCGVMHPGARNGSDARTDAGTTGGVLPSAGPVRGNAPCVAATPSLEVTGARFGLSTQFVQGRQELVPSWLFSTEQPSAGASGPATSAMTLAQPAVDPKFITPAGPATPIPLPSPSGPGAPRTSQERVESYTADGRTLSLRFWGGVCSTYSAKVTAQSGDAVRVRITGTVKDPKQKCVMLAKSVTVKATLDQPLGDRKVYDSADGHAVAARK